jgi:hypothetical protein
MVAHLLWCQRDHTIDDLSIHLLRCLFGSEHITTHDTLWDIVIAIDLESGTHFKGKPPTFFLTTPKNEWISLSLDMVSKL